MDLNGTAIHGRESETDAAPLVAVVGPTASGKSALAAELARRLGGEVIVCDSTQVYRGFDIGTAKPSERERGGIAHHMIDLVDAGEIFSAGDYRRRAEEVLRDLQRRGRLPILTVGTGLYLRALIEGLADAPARSEELRARLAAIGAKRGGEYLHRMLARRDRAASARIAVNDRQKLIRALEVCLLAGKPITEVHGAGRERLAGYRAIKIGLQPPREALYARIEQRVHRMLAAGWLDEVAAMIAAGVPASAKPFEFIGYRELREHLEAGKPLAAAIAAIAQATRRYAKRQLTWFRREQDVRWFPGFGDDPAIAAAVMAVLAAQLGEPTRAGNSNLPPQTGKAGSDV